jgi:parvulin-like peptidyl-prolyl isomerase
MSKQKTKTKIVSKKHIARREREKKQAALIRNIAIGIVVAVLLLIGYGYLDQTVFQKNKAIAAVNDEKITVSQFQARTRLERENLINQYIQYFQFGQQYGMDFSAQTDPIEELLSNPLDVGKNVRDTMINELVYRQEANKRGITVSTEEIEKAVQEYMGYFPEGTPTPAPTKESVMFEEYPTLTDEQVALVTITPTSTLIPTFTPSPTATASEEEADATPTTEAVPTIPPLPTLTPTPYTEDGYQKAYQEVLNRYADAGMSEDDFRFLFESQLYYEALYEIVTKDVPTEGEQVWVRHILVPDAALADVVIQRLQDGDDFSKLAEEMSLDPSAKSNYGNLGWFGHNVMVPEFEEAAFALEEIGEISPPVKTQFGYHVLQLLGREKRPLDENTLQMEKDRVFQEWVEEIKQDYDIEIFDWEKYVIAEPDLQQTLIELFGQPQ